MVNKLSMNSTVFSITMFNVELESLIIPQMYLDVEGLGQV